MIANPWVILALVIGLAVSHTYAFIKGGTVIENAIKATYAKQLEQTIQEHNDNAAIDMAAAAEWGAKRAAAAARSNTQAGKIDQDIAAHPLDCRLAEPSVRLLNDGVAAANDLTPGAGVMPGPVSGDPVAGIGRRVNPPPLGEPRLRPSGGVPPPAR